MNSFPSFGERAISVGMETKALLLISLTIKERSWKTWNQARGKKLKDTEWIAPVIWWCSMEGFQCCCKQLGYLWESEDDGWSTKGRRNQQIANWSISKLIWNRVKLVTWKIPLNNCWVRRHSVWCSKRKKNLTLIEEMEGWKWIPERMWENSIQQN